MVIFHSYASSPEGNGIYLTWMWVKMEDSAKNIWGKSSISDGMWWDVNIFWDYLLDITLW